jgi:hypothetical protein
VRETLARGGDACRPLVAANGLSRSFVDPALALLARRGVAVRFGRRLRAIEFAAGRAAQLLFGDDAVELGPGDQVALAVPAWTAAELVPGLAVPDEYRAIVNGHFQIVPPLGTPMLLGVLNGTVEWIFAFADRVSVTVSAADRLLGVKRRELAQMFWLDIQAATGVATPLPPWQIVKEKRATFAALPGENRKRPGTRTKWSNLFLAGDFTQTGLPATIEGAVRSGFRAAELALATAQSS